MGSSKTKHKVMRNENTHLRFIVRNHLIDRLWETLGERMDADDSDKASLTIVNNERMRMRFDQLKNSISFQINLKISEGKSKIQ
jgi:hypothetical protein